MDSPLWKLLFRLEGWNSNFPQVRAYEETERQKQVQVKEAQMKEKERKTRTRADISDMETDKPSSKKRLRSRIPLKPKLPRRLPCLSQTMP